MEKRKDNRIPPMIEGGIYMGNEQWSINHSAVADGEGGYEYESVELPVGVWEYGAIVNGVIESWYPNDVMQAVVNNYLLGEGEEVFEKMQKDRIRAKIIACEALIYGHDEGIVEPDGFIREEWVEKLEELKKKLDN